MLLVSLTSLTTLLIKGGRRLKFSELEKAMNKSGKKSKNEDDDDEALVDDDD